jgi:hypothetical protein
MGETDMGDQTGVPADADTTTAEQVSREDWAEQRRAEARAHFEPPSHFDTPAWMGPGTREYTPPQVPVQPEPVHDQLHVYAPSPIADSVPDEAHWVERRKPRVLVGILLSLALAGAVASLVLAIVNQSAIAVGALVGCGIVAVIFRGALMSSGLTTVDLKSSTLKVRQDNELSVFNLADPATRVEVTGAPGTSDWAVVLESVHHREVILTSAHVNSKEFDKILLHYRAVAERERQERHDRFNR